MTTDELLPEGAPTRSAPWRDTWRADIVARLNGWLAATSIAARVGGGFAVCAVAAVAWLTLRPRHHPPIETRLPQAVASGPTGSASTGTGASAVATLVIHTVGAVRAPGVVRVPAGARVLDAVAAAGGPSEDADLQRVNLAAKLVDGQRVVVPHVGIPMLELAPDVGSGGSAVEPAAPVNLNDATAAQLDTLPGVGPATAAAIVAHRTQNGPFRTVDSLADVRGIGPAKLEQLRPLVTV